MKKHVWIPLAVIFLSVIGCSKPDNGGKDNPQPPATPVVRIAYSFVAAADAAFAAPRLNKVENSTEFSVLELCLTE